MEAIPRMLMLSIELKESAERVEFGQELKQYISQHYMEDASKYNEEIRQIDQLRSTACNVTRDFNGISTLKKYYGQLHLLTSRFPTDLITFSWIDTFDEEPYTHTDVNFEQSCILFNLGTLHSILGAIESRASEEEMKVACTHFQCAAGAFSYLKDHFQCDMSPDISFELMNMYINTMLGQAQECLLEKSMQDNRKSSLVARISSQVVEYYKQALKGLEDSNTTSLMGSRRSKWWKKTLQIKLHHFTSIAYMYMSNQAEEQQKYGERVAYLTHAQNKHNEAVKMGKGQPESITEALNFAKDVIVGKFQSAKKDNEFVYHDTVPPIESLAEIKGASLVKALTFQPYDEGVAGPDIFRKLVPMEAHEASSLYSEEKAKLLRRVGDQIEDKNKHLDQYLSAVKLEQLKLPGSDPEVLPQVLLEVCAALSVKTEPIKTLVNSMQELSGVVMDVDSSLKEIEQLMQEEEKQEAEFQKEFGTKSAKQGGDIKKELGKCRELHATASQSNTELHKAMQTNIDNIKLLASPVEKLQATLPSAKDARTEEDEDAEKKMQRLLGKVEEMKTQRETLEGQLRDQIKSDDVTGDIVTRTRGSMQEFFKEQLKKHETLITYIEQNLSAQDNILKAMTEANAAYAERRKLITDVGSKRDEKISELINSYTVYDDLIEKSNKGIGFYKKLEGTVTKLLAKTKGLVKANHEERQEKYRKKYPPQRPAAAKPVSSMAGYPTGFAAAGVTLAGVPGIAGQVGPSAPGSMAPPPVAAAPSGPQGPKLSDYWKPKSGRTGSVKAQPQVSQVPQAPPSQPHVYPGGAIPGSAAMSMPGQVPGSYPQHGVPTSAGHHPPGLVAGMQPSPRVPRSGPAVPPGSHGAPQVSMAQPRFPGPSGQQQVPGQGMHPQHGVPPQSQALPQVPQQAPLVHPPNVPQGSNQSNQSPVVPQQAPRGNQVPPNAGVAPSMQAPAPQMVPNAANQVYNQQPQHQNQMVPARGMGHPSQVHQMVPHSSAHQQQLPQSSGQAMPNSLPSQPQSAPGIPQPTTVTQPPIQPPPAYGSQQHHIAKAASMATPSAPSQPSGPQNSSDYAYAHLSTSTNTTASHMPGNNQYQAIPNSSQSGPAQPPAQNQIVPNSASQTQMSNVQMPSQLGNPQHQPALSQGQPQGNWQQQQNIHQQQLHQQQIQQQQMHQQQQKQLQQQPGAQGPTGMPNTSMSQQSYPSMQPQQGMGNIQKQPGVQQFSQQQQHHLNQQNQQPGLPAQHQNQQVPTPHQQKQLPPQQNVTAQNYSPVAQPRGQLPNSQPQPLQNVPQQQQQQQQQQPHMKPTQQVFPQVHQQQQVHQQPQQPVYQVPSTQPQSAQKPLGQQVLPQQGISQGPPQQQVQPQVQYPQGPQQVPGGTQYQSSSSPSKQHVPSSQSQGQTQMQVGGSHTAAGAVPPLQQVQPQVQFPQGLQQVPGGGPYQNTSSPIKQQVPPSQPQGQTPMQGGVSNAPGNAVPPQQQVQPQVQYPQRPQQVPGGGPYQNTSSPSKQQLPPSQQQGQTQMQGGVPHVASGTGNYQPTGPNQQQGIVRPNVNQPMQQTQQQQQFIPQQQIQPQFQQNQPRQQTPIQPGVQPPQNQQFLQQQQRQQPQNQSPQHLQQTNPGAGNPGYVAQSNMKPPFQATPQQQLRQPLQPMNPVLQIKQQQTFEQQRLPQPVLQPMKPTTKPTDLLSTSPDRDNQPLKDVLAPQTVPTSSSTTPQATQSVVDPNSNVSVLASIDVQPTNSSQNQQSPSQSLSQLSNIVINSSATPPMATTSSTSDILAALKLQPSLSVPPPTTRPTSSTVPQQLPSVASTQPGNNNLATSHPQAATPAPLAATATKFAGNDPYADKESLEKLVEEVERLDKYVEGLYRKMLSGPTVIERLWKELTDYQDRETRQFSIAIARCYSVKNRHPDIMPYDHNRVCLRGTRDDYINASSIQDIVPASPSFIATQAPLQPSIADFWLMVYEQQASIIAMLVSKPTTGKGSASFITYWPDDRGAPLKHGDISLSLQSKRTTDYHVERIIHLTHLPTRQMRTITHLQFTAWPEFGVPSSPGNLLQFIGEVQNYHSQQRKVEIPMVVHCSSGIERTGVFTLIYTAIREINLGHGIPDISQMVKKLRLQRKWMVTEKEQLKFGYDAVLCYAQHELAKRGIATKSLVAASPLDAKIAPSRLNSFDVIMGTEPVDSLISRISKFSVKPNQPQPTPNSIVEESIPSEAATEVNASPAQSIETNGGVQPTTIGDDANGGMIFQGVPEQPIKDQSQDPPSNSTQSVPSDTGSSTPSGVGSFTSSPAHSTHKTKSLDQLQANNLEVFSQTLQNFVGPDVVESSKNQDSTDNASEGSGSTDAPNSSLPSILADLTPQNFSIKEKGQSKQKMSRADFLASKGGLKESVDKADPGDPFGGIDPMWSMKSKASEPKQS